MLDLKFLGIGSAFQTHLYNNTAFFIEGETLFLLDCGETAFEQLKRQSFFENIEEIYVLFTHTHSDHIGGLGELVEHCEKKLNNKLNIVVPNKQANSLYTDINDLLTIFSLSSDKCNFMLPEELENKHESFQKVEFLPTNRAPMELGDKCYSLFFNTAEGPILYTSDSNDTKYIKALVDTNSYSKIFADVTLTIPQVHLDLNLLNEIVPENQKEKVYCMHFDSPKCLEKAKELGFNIAPTTAKDLSHDKPKFDYLELDDRLILSNCGESTFMHLNQNDILKDINEIFLQLENTNHSSVASLGSLLTYCYFVLKKPLYILNNADDIKEKINRLVELYGTPKESIVFLPALKENIFPNESTNNKQKL